MDDLAGNIRRDQHLLRADIGVVGGDITSARQIKHQPDQHRERRQADQQDHAQALAAEPREPAGFLGRRSLPRRGLGFGRRNDLQRLFTHDASPIGGVVAGRIAIDRRAQILFDQPEIAQHPFARLVDRGRRAPSPSCPRRVNVSRSSSGRAAGVRNNRLARRSFGSARRSIRSFSASRSSRRVSVIGCRSRHLGEFRLLEAFGAVEPEQHRPLRARVCRIGAPAGRR